MTGKLRLGPLPNQEMTKVTVTLSATLRQDLDDYGRAYAEAFGQTVDLASLIPHMLTAFMAKDRGFMRIRSEQVRTRTASRP
jgi:hypothetical protein